MDFQCLGHPTGYLYIIILRNKCTYLHVNVHVGLSKYRIYSVTLLNNESTVGADASVEALKLYDMKLLTLAKGV